jgi:hypothetical protein
MRYELSDFEWAAIEPFLPNKSRGVPRVDDRRVRAEYSEDGALYRVRAVVDCFEKALLAENGNQLPEKLQAKLAEIAKLAAPRQRERE